MTRTEFLNLDWSDSHVGYDIEVVGDDTKNRFRSIAYMTLSEKYPNCLCLVTDNKDFPLFNSGCGISKNICPMDIINLLKKNKSIERIIAVIDGEVYDLKPETIYINGIDGLVCFEEIPYKDMDLEKTNDNNINDIELD